MPRDLKAHEHGKRARARREFALQRRDLREPSTPRAAAAGVTSHAVKKIDTDTRAAIDAFLRAKNGGAQ
jgi:hypothetical protein